MNTEFSDSTDNRAEIILGCFGALVFIAAVPFIMALGTLYEAFICTKLWAWFVAPYVPLKAVPLVVFVAADFIVLLLFRTRTPDRSKRKMSEVWTETLGMVVLYPSALWLTAYLIHRWVA